MAGPRVTVVIPTLAADSTLVDCVRSLERQTLTDFEVVTVDNSSRQLVRQSAVASSQVRIIEKERNVGFGSAVNEAYRTASAPFLATSDSAVLAFLKQLRRTLRAPLALIWDQLRAHRFEPVAGWLAQHRHHVRAYLLPAYAPELNPVDLIWGYAKTNPLANFAPVELHDLVMQTQLATYAIADDEMLLRSFIQHCALSLRLN